MLLPLLMQLGMLGRDRHDGAGHYRLDKANEEFKAAGESRMSAVRKAFDPAADPLFDAADSMDDEDELIILMLSHGR